MLSHDPLISNPLREGYLSLLNSPGAACTRHTIAVAIAGSMKHQIIDVPPVGAKQLTLMRALPEMRALEVRDSMRGFASFFENDPLCCKIVVSSDGP